MVSNSVTTMTYYHILNLLTTPGNHVNFDDERFVDIHTLCGAFKLWFRELPEPIFPYQMYDDAIESSREYHRVLG